jgi:hypothetical protein
MTLKSHLLHVLSVPYTVDDATWRKWYETEHLPDMVYCGVAAVARLHYRIDNPLGLEPPDDKRFFAMYHADSPRQLHCKEYIEDVRHDSLIWGKGVGAKSIGLFDIRNYKLLSEHNPKNLKYGAL